MATFQPTIATSAMYFVFLGVGLAGCTNEASPPAAVEAHGSHTHSAVGPHHGELIELGNEEYHAELLHDAQSVTIYVLDAGADRQVPIEAAEITINAKRDGKPVQFTLEAAPDEGDPPGKSSRFVCDDAELAGHLDQHGAEPRIAVTIQGKSYRGQVMHTHDHH